MLTVGLSLTRPRLGRFRVQPATAALFGAFLMALFGLLPLEQVGSALAFLGLPILTIASLMVITLVAERAGLFRHLAWRIAVAAHGDGRRLFAYLFLLGVITGALFTNDAAVLIFTPMVFSLVREVEDGWTPAQRMPYYFAVLYVANLVGPLVISNPINIIVARWFDIGFLEYARSMLLPALASILATYVGMRIFFRRVLAHTYRVPQTIPPITHPRFFLASAVVLLLTLVGFFTEHLTGIRTAYVAAIGAAAILVVFRATAKGRPVEIARDVGWDALIFVGGIFVVAQGLRAAGLTDALGRLILQAHESGAGNGTFATGFLAAGCSALMNNHPVATTMAYTIRDLGLDPGQTKQLAYAALIGADLGPKMLPIGSLAALLWFRILRSRGVEVSYWLYIKMGVPITLFAIAVSILTLNLLG